MGILSIKQQQLLLLAPLFFLLLLLLIPAPSQQKFIQNIRQPFLKAQHSISFQQLKISAFNIQTFGVTKMSKPHVVKVLVDTLKRYDLILIQEIRDVSETAIVELLARLNLDSSFQYDMILSIRLGRTNSKEQYAYFYKTSIFRVEQTYQHADDDDIFERPPYSAIFSVIPNSDVAKFGYMALHAKPTDAVSEIDALVDVYDEVKGVSGTDDFIIGGDLNAACNYVKPDDWDSIRLRTQQRFLWAIGDDIDTTVNLNHCTYDRLVLVGENIRNSLVTDSGNAFYFDVEFGLTQEVALEVSDHFPVHMTVN